MEDNICLLCDLPIGDEASKKTVKTKAINTLVDASKKRKDRRFLKFRNLDLMVVHDSCYVSYTRGSAIKNASTSEDRFKEEKKKATSFDFDNFCFFCDEGCSKQYSAKCVSFVTNNSIRDTILNKIDSVSNTETLTLLKLRLQSTKNLATANAWYHRNCYQRFLTSFNRNLGSVQNDLAEFLDFIIVSITNSEECQFSLKSFINLFENKSLVVDTLIIKERLKSYFQDDIKIYENDDEPDELLICFSSVGGKALNENWYKQKLTDEEKDKTRIVKAAARIILQDIKTARYDTSSYKNVSLDLTEIFKDVPENLKIFLDYIIKHKKKIIDSEDANKWDKRVATISHAIISAVRPRSFLSPIQLGLSTLIYKNFASKTLIDTLAGIGCCSSYFETQLFECSVMKDFNNYKIDKTAFIQFIFDNADHNVVTIDGKNTFHAMGGAMTINPGSALNIKSEIKRLTTVPSADELGSLGSVQLKTYALPCPPSLEKLKILDLTEFERVPSVQTSPLNFLWYCNKFLNTETAQGWMSWMESATKMKSFSTSKIIPLPFVNEKPGDINTILTVLKLAEKRGKTLNQKIIFVTFDQPLYWKARCLLEINKLLGYPLGLESIRVRLGGFHMFMSYLGGVGNIMSGSGITEILSEVYAEGSIPQMLGGHAFARSWRGFSLIQTALANIIVSKLNLLAPEKRLLQNTIDLLEDEEFHTHLNAAAVEDIKKKFDEMLKALQLNGPTSQLWVQFYEMIEIGRNFVEAERSGNWALHKQTVQRMIPIFHASGHHLYAKSSHLYLQDMYQLEQEMDVQEYEEFSKHGAFTIRRAKKFFSGVWTDMIIEQEIMRSMHDRGGITRGRKISPSVLARYVLSKVSLINVCQEMESFCKVKYSTSEQHSDIRPSCISKDATDLQKITEFLKSHDPFPENEDLVSLGSGIVADNRINCHKAFEVGAELQKKIIGKTFGLIKQQTKLKVLPLSAVNSSVTLDDGEVVPINPLLIFQRLILKLNSQDDMKNYLNFELAPFPVSIFDEKGFRKSAKSKFYDCFHSLPESKVIESPTCVIDGGFLLHKVAWQSNEKVEDIIELYFNFVNDKYPVGSVIVFDGYPADKSQSTKSFERNSRGSKKSGCYVQFTRSTVINAHRESFLSVDKNKVQLIQMLTERFEGTDFETRVAEEDADLLIVETALEESVKPENDNVIIIGQDIDLLVILHELACQKNNVYFKKIGDTKNPDKMYSSHCFKYENLSGIVGFLHAFSGCDTTSSFYYHPKNSIAKVINENQELIAQAQKFYDGNSSQDTLASAGKQIISKIYSAESITEDMAELRFNLYKKTHMNPGFKLESLPPTSSAAKCHSLRAFLQVHQWFGRDLNPTEYGWKCGTRGLRPILTEDKLIPDNLIKTISCSCKTGCTRKSCSCRKHGLLCTNMCSGCNGLNCSNCEKIHVMPQQLDAVFEDEDSIKPADLLQLIQDNEPENDEWNEDHEQDNENDDAMELDNDFDLGEYLVAAKRQKLD